MNRITKLKICDWSLLIITAATLASGIQLESMGAEAPQSWVGVHIAVCTLFMGLCAWHIQLHFNRSNWFARFSKVKSPVTRALWWVGLLTLLTGIIAAIRWIASPGHSPIGGIHGKIGFLMILIAMGHIVKRIKFFKNRKK